MYEVRWYGNKITATGGTDSTALGAISATVGPFESRKMAETTLAALAGRREFISGEIIVIEEE